MRRREVILSALGALMTVDRLDLTAMGIRTVRLFRSVCDAEHAQWEATHIFATAPNSLDGKWFALRREDAVEWGRWFFSKSGVRHDRIIAVSVPENLYDRFGPNYQKLDGIGPACFAPIQLLEGIVFEEVME